MEKPVASRLGSRPAACCGVFRDLEAMGAIVWTRNQNFVFDFSCGYAGAAIKPLHWCPHCGFEWRTRGAE